MFLQQLAFNSLLSARHTLRIYLGRNMLNIFSGDRVRDKHATKPVQFEPYNEDLTVNATNCGLARNLGTEPSSSGYCEADYAAGVQETPCILCLSAMSRAKSAL